MNSVIASQPSSAPHLLPQARLSPSRSLFSPSTMTGRKRKAEDNDGDRDRMSTSPSPSLPQQQQQQQQLHPPSHRNSKRLRTNIAGRPLALPRLLETLGADDMRNLLRSICERHPEIGAEVVATAPRPSVSSALDVLGNYHSSLEASFPFGGRRTSDYAYNRVRQPLHALFDALKDYTPHFLPPNEAQPATSLSYLDGATEVIHKLPDWDTFQNNRHKQEAYEEISKAWVLVIREAAKRGGGIQLQYGGWDQKLAQHNERSGGKMQEAINELRENLGWMGGDTNIGATSGTVPSDTASIREQLFNGSYGLAAPVRVGW